MLLKAAVCLATVWLALAPAPATAQTVEAAPAEKGYFRRHLLHWVIAFGTNFASNEYQDRVGTSTEPLLFSDPPGIDRWVRDRTRSDTPVKNYVLQRRSTAALALSAGAIFFANLGRERAGRWMADDATGFVEIWFFDKGASQFVKNIVGRQRPELEFIDENTALTPQEKAELEADVNERHSFYSGATSRQFALMSYCDRIVSGRTRHRAVRVASFVGFYGFAAYVGWSRLNEDEHYFTDVVAGAAAGIFTARGFYRAHHPESARGSAGAEPPRVSFGGIAPVPGGASILFTVRP